jgi:hypothetical protein
VSPRWRGDVQRRSHSTLEASTRSPANASDEDADPPAGNGSTAPEADPSAPLRLPGNPAMEGAEVVERGPERVPFRWTGPAGQARPTFDVPGSRCG